MQQCRINENTNKEYKRLLNFTPLTSFYLLSSRNTNSPTHYLRPLISFDTVQRYYLVDVGDWRESSVMLFQYDGVNGIVFQPVVDSDNCIWWCFRIRALELIGAVSSIGMVANAMENNLEIILN